MIIQKANQSIQAFWDYYTNFCINWCSRVEFVLSLVWKQCVYFFIKHNLLSPLVLHEFPLLQDTVMACLSMWHKNVKASPALLILSVTYLFDFVAGGKKEGGNIFLPLLWFSLSKMKIIFITSIPQKKKFQGSSYTMKYFINVKLYFSIP